MCNSFFSFPLPSTSQRQRFCASTNALRRNSTPRSPALRSFCWTPRKTHTGTMPRATHKKWEQEDWRVDIIAAAGEFVGTFLFLLFGLGGIQAARTASQAQGVAGAGGQAASGGEQSVTVPDPSFLLMAATSMAMALIFSIWIFFRATGGCGVKPESLGSNHRRRLSPNSDLRRGLQPTGRTSFSLSVVARLKSCAESQARTHTGSHPRPARCHLTHPIRLLLCRTAFGRNCSWWGLAGLASRSSQRQLQSGKRYVPCKSRTRRQLLTN